jgi:2-amino-4-hydroxy-6-hydroxymethyldihydropteridine diphosphokinase
MSENATPRRAGIALGSNLGDRMAHLRAAIAALREIHTPGGSFLIATVYQTEPRHCPPGSPPFLNTAIEMSFTGAPLDLLALTQAAEVRLGRESNPERNAPRVIDIDILYLGGETLDHPALTLPHPRIGERRFVLRPLADIRPGLMLPGSALSIRETLERLVTDEAPLVAIGENL